MISALRRQTLPYLRDSETLLRAENQWQQARVLIGKVAQHALGYREVLAEQRMGVLREIGAALITTFDSAGLMDVLARQLPRLDIAGAYLALYEDPRQPTGPARLLLACDEQGRVEIEAGSEVFPASQLAPAALWPPAGPYSLVAMPLYFREEQLGFVMFEANPQDGPMYEALREQISSALQGALLVQARTEAEAALEKAYAEVENRAVQLQTAAEVSRATSSVLDPDELMQQAVDLVRDRFNLYYAGFSWWMKIGQLRRPASRHRRSRPADDQRAATNSKWAASR